MSREGLIASVGISEAADRTGLSAHTLRYYERAGLIQPTERGDRGERRYASRDLRWVEFLQRLRATRMPVREMKQFAELRRGGAKTVAARRELVDATAFVKGEWGAEIVDVLAPQEGDVILEGKRGLDAFATTNLDILRGRGITTIALAGFLTNCCVESTMRTGYEKGYQVITLSDCVAAMSPEEHENAIRFNYPMFSEVMTSQAFMGELRAAAMAAH